MVDPVKIFLTSGLITMPKLVVVYHTLWAHGGPKTFGDAAGPRTTLGGGMADS